MSKSKAVFYHAGCPVCVQAEDKVAHALDPQRYDVQIIHLGQDKSRIAEARNSGVKSVPALVMDGAALHINFGASLDDLQ